MVGLSLVYRESKQTKRVKEKHCRLASSWRPLTVEVCLVWCSPPLFQKDWTQIYKSLVSCLWLDIKKWSKLPLNTQKIVLPDDALPAMTRYSYTSLHQFGYIWSDCIWLFAALSCFHEGFFFFFFLPVPLIFLNKCCNLCVASSLFVKCRSQQVKKGISIWETRALKWA